MSPRSGSLVLFLMLSLYSPGTQAQWVQTMPESTILSFAVRDINLFAGAQEEPFRISGFSVFGSTDNGTIWTNVGTNPSGTNVNALAFNGSNLFAGTDGSHFYNYDGVYFSSNSGTSWTATSLNVPVYALTMKESSLFAGASGGGVYLSTDNGATWTSVTIELTNTFVVTFAVIGTDLFAGTGGGGAYRSTNNGASWTAVNSGLMNANVNALAISGTDLFAGTWGGGIFRSTDNGATWAPASDGLTNTIVFALTVSESTLFAGTCDGVFLSTNNGANWNAANEGLATNTCVRSLAIDASYLFAGTWGRGIWRRPLSELVSVENNQEPLPETSSLGQNYPNPFNPSTTIPYQLAAQSRVTLKLFDVLGREIAVLANGIEEGGYRSVLWDASDVTSGVYFCQLKVGPSVEWRKMSLVR
ncbi:MAG: T9SS type A sorting domain-containing protein [Bacteroidota bacterium]